MNSRPKTSLRGKGGGREGNHSAGEDVGTVTDGRQDLAKRTYFSPQDAGMSFARVRQVMTLSYKRVTS